MKLLEKTVTLSFTTLFLYTLIGIIQHRTILYPFPFNEITFAFNGIISSILLFNSHKNISISLGICAILFFLSNEGYWSSILSYEQMEFFSKMMITDFCFFFFNLILLISSIYTLNQSKAHRLIPILFAGLILFGLIFNQIILLSIASFLCGISLHQINKEKSNTPNSIKAISILQLLLSFEWFMTYLTFNS
jgi:hypothetical protein